jgi:hypothetical protein
MIGQFLKIFSSETAGQMNRTLVGDIYGNLYRGPSVDASYQVSVHSLRFASHAIESFLT